MPGPLALMGPTSQCPVDQCPDRTEETFPLPVWRWPAARLAMLSLPLVAASGCYGPTGPAKDRRPAGVPKLPDCRRVELSEDGDSESSCWKDPKMGWRSLKGVAGNAGSELAMRWTTRL